MRYFDQRREKAFREWGKGSVAKGSSFTVKIHDNHVIKTPSSSITHPKLVKEQALHGMKMLEIAGVHIAGQVEGVEKGVHDIACRKAVDIEKDKVHRHIEDIVEEVWSAYKGNTRFNVMLSSFGKDANGKVVVRDTNEVSRIKEKNPEEFFRMLEELKADLKCEGAYSERLGEKIDSLRDKKLGIVRKRKLFG